MITLDPEKSILNIADRKKGDKREETGTAEFDSLFKDLIKTEDASNTVSGQDTAVFDIRPVRFSEPTPSSQATTVDHVQQLIETMDVYQQKLSEPRATLKEIEPYLEDLASHAKSLEDHCNSVSDDDELKAIVNQSLALASMEIVRYRNGEYNNP
ncbi:hypothetical protein DESC_290106 [Desulfosarcina cetonica]|uniref:hypothetical protein n=1 Tax=Desulfosarcina cetonica TaxID=90730 RepID=UPI0006CF4942|nr:hypothetical protein [Desulfosarcina cetonica]VTR65036.1 hypothetical protein DESC_290106 [Desulfosarcina cetonica]